MATMKRPVPPASTNAGATTWSYGGAGGSEHKSFHRTMEEAREAKGRRATGDVAPPRGRRRRFDSGPRHSLERSTPAHLTSNRPVEIWRSNGSIP